MTDTAPERIWLGFHPDYKYTPVFQTPTDAGEHGWLNTDTPARTVEYVRADLAAQQGAETPAESDFPETEIAGVGNYYGGLLIRRKNGKAEWCIEDHSGLYWEPCPAPVFAALAAMGGTE